MESSTVESSAMKSAATVAAAAMERQDFRRKRKSGDNRRDRRQLAKHQYVLLPRQRMSIAKVAPQAQAASKSPGS
jgi:hypothetical protein